MSAEGFVVYYGLRWDIRLDDEATVQALERREDQRIQSARQHGLETYWGRTEEERRRNALFSSWARNSAVSAGKGRTQPRLKRRNCCGFSMRPSGS
jgi:hypothetical protein